MPSRRKPGARLFDLKEWLTVPDAARHLSIVFGEEVSEADVLRLALDHRLRLSVRFVNHASARLGRLVPSEEALYRPIPPIFGEKWEGPELPASGVTIAQLQDLHPEIQVGLAEHRLVLLPKFIHYTEHEWLDLKDEMESIGGVWDLPLLGNEGADVEHEFQNETGGPAVTLMSLDGTFVERDGVVAQLQDDYDDNEYQVGSKAHLEAIKARILEDRIEQAKASELLAKHKADRAKYLEQRKSRPAKSNYYPAGKLPEDSVFVVRTSALREFEHDVVNAPQASVKRLTRREDTTYLNIIAALLGLMLGKTPAGKPQSVFDNESSIIAALLSHHEGKPGIAARTLQGKFAAAKRSLDT